MPNGPAFVTGCILRKSGSDKRPGVSYRSVAVQVVDAAQERRSGLPDVQAGPEDRDIPNCESKPGSPP